MFYECEAHDASEQEPSKIKISIPIGQRGENWNASECKIDSDGIHIMLIGRGSEEEDGVKIKMEDEDDDMVDTINLPTRTAALQGKGQSCYFEGLDEMGELSTESVDSTLLVVVLCVREGLYGTGS